MHAGSRAHGKCSLANAVSQHRLVKLMVKLQGHLRPLYPEARQNPTVWINWYYSPPPLPDPFHHHHHQLPTSASTNQIPRPSNWMVLEGSYRSLPRLTSSCHSYWCGDIVLSVDSLELKNVRFRCNTQRNHFQCFWRDCLFIGKPPCDLYLPAGCSDVQEMPAALWS